MPITLPLQMALLEIKRFLRDPTALALTLATPVILAVLLAAAFSGSTQFATTASIVDLDQSSGSVDLVDHLTGVSGLTVEPLTEDEAAGLLDRADRLLITVIKPGYGEGLRGSGAAAQIEFRVRAGGGDEGQIVMGLVREMVRRQSSEIAARIQFRQLAGELSLADDPQQIDAAFESALAANSEQPLVTVTRVAEAGTSGNSFDLYFPGILTMFVMYSVAANAGAIVAERRLGTLERLMATSLGTGGIFTGKYLASLVRAITPVLLLASLAWAINRSFSPQQFLQILIVGALMAAAAAAIGMLIAAVARTHDQANFAGVTITLVMATIGGSFFRFEYGGILDVISRFSLNRYANDALQGIVEEGAGLADYWLELGVLAAASLALLLLGRLLFSGLRGN